MFFGTARLQDLERLITHSASPVPYKLRLRQEPVVCIPPTVSQPSPPRGSDCMPGGVFFRRPHFAFPQSCLAVKRHIPLTPDLQPLPRCPLYSVVTDAQLEQFGVLNSLLSPHMSYPLIAMCRPDLWHDQQLLYGKASNHDGGLLSVPTNCMRIPCVLSIAA